MNHVEVSNNSMSYESGLHTLECERQLKPALAEPL
jgi:hypothetical protein